MTIKSASAYAVEFADRLHHELAVGWNTWDTRSVLRHVLLPDGLAISLGFAINDKLVWLNGDTFPGRKQLGRTPGTLLTSLDKRLPLGDAIEIRPGLHAYDGSYTQLSVDIRGAAFDIETAAEGSVWVAIIHPRKMERWQRTLTIHGSVLWNRPGTVECVSATEMLAKLPSRAISIYADGVSVEDPNLPTPSPYLALSLNGPIVISAGRKFAPNEAAKFVAASRARQVAQHDSYGELRDGHEAMQACLAWNVIYEPKFNRVLATVARDWNVIRGGYAVFCWDSFFMSWMMNLDHPTLGYATTLESFRELVNDQFVPNIVQGNGRSSADRSQPAVGSFALLAMHKQRSNEAALAAAFPALLAWNRWWHTDRRNCVGSLSPGSNPFEPRSGDPTEFVQPNTRAGGALEAGLDNVNIYDDVPFDTTTHLLEAEDIGLNATYVADCKALAEIAKILGHDAEAKELADRGSEYDKALGKLFCEAEGLFLNRRLDNGEFIQRHCLTSFWSLASGSATPAQAERMLREHLANPERFDGEWILPMSPRNDPAFAEQIYLRGRVWPPTNFLVYLGMRRYFGPEQRRKLVDRSLKIVVDSWKQFGVVGENYSAIDGSGGREIHTHPLHGWGGLFAMIALIEAGRAAEPFNKGE